MPSSRGPHARDGAADRMGCRDGHMGHSRHPDRGSGGELGRKATDWSQVWRDSRTDGLHDAPAARHRT